MSYKNKSPIKTVKTDQHPLSLKLTALDNIGCIQTVQVHPTCKLAVHDQISNKITQFLTVIFFSIMFSTTSTTPKLYLLKEEKCQATPVSSHHTASDGGLNALPLHCGENVFSTKRIRDYMSNGAVSDVAAKINILDPARNRIQSIQPEDHRVTNVYDIPSMKM